ncbi:hypothetical protein D043_4833A, partial [Vibrio parahaemolyticus EKP-021]|jgi:hypothetical protein
MMSP